MAETQRIEVVEGKTPEITAAEIQRFLTSIDITKLVGRRGLVAISVLIYTAARAGAVARLRRGDFHGRLSARAAPTSSSAA